MAFRVALFSVLCAAATVVLAFVIVRRLGGGRIPAAAAAAVLVTGTSTWFYAGYEKHNAFTGLLVAVTIAAVLRWHETGARWSLVAAAIAGGLLVGGAWQTAAVCLPAVAVAVATSRHRTRVAALATAGAVATGVAVACYGFVLWRAGAEPGVNWGRADSLGRLAHLVTMEDFGFTEDKVVSGSTGSDRSATPFAGLTTQTFRYLRLLTYETTVVTVLAALVGLSAAIADRRRRRPASVVGVLLATNVLVVAYAVGTGGSGFTSLLMQGGFLVGAVLAVAVGAGLAVAELTSRLTPQPRHRRKAPPPSTVPVWAGLALAAVMVVPAAATNAAQLERRTPDFARQYAANVLVSLPDDAVLLAWGAERVFPLQYAQVVHRERPDVDVVLVDALLQEWYRDEVESRLPVNVPSPAQVPDPADYAGALVERLEAVGRPIYIDLASAQVLREGLGYAPNGIVGEVVGGETGALPTDVDAAEALIDSYDMVDVATSRHRFRWPNAHVHTAYLRMHLEMARAYVEEERYEDALRHVRSTLAIDPANELALENLRALEVVLSES
jgi:hypothetical protein